MAILTDAIRSALMADCMRDCSNGIRPIGVTKTDLRAAVNAIDDWFDANAASFNSAIPLAARQALTTKEKLRIAIFILRRRMEAL